MKWTEKDLQRRDFLRGAAIVSGSAAAAAAAFSTAAAAPAAAAADAAPGIAAQEAGAPDAADYATPATFAPDSAATISVLFEGANQAGVYRPARPQAASCFASFALTATSAEQLKTLLQTLTGSIRFLTQGGTPVALGSSAPPSDSEVLGPEVPPDGLTVTVGLAAGAFDHRFGLASKAPAGLTQMRLFPDDVPDPAWLGGDLLLQICANSPDTVHHALRQITKVTRAWMQPQWQVNGFVSPPRPSGTPRNLFGYKDGIANPAEDTGLVWIGKDSGQPDWAVGGTFIVVRLIRMLIEFWDRVSVSEQDTMIGRRRDTGAPLSGNTETDVPSYSNDSGGAVIPLTAHIRLANPRTTETNSSRLLRRGYNFTLGTDINGNQNVGLVFACYQHNIQQQFETVQERLEGEPMTDYIQTFGGQYFIGLPGVQGATGYLGQGLFS